MNLHVSGRWPEHICINRGMTNGSFTKEQVEAQIRDQLVRDGFADDVARSAAMRGADHYSSRPNNDSQQPLLQNVRKTVETSEREAQLQRHPANSNVMSVTELIPEFLWLVIDQNAAVAVDQPKGEWDSEDS